MTVEDLLNVRTAFKNLKSVDGDSTELIKVKDLKQFPLIDEQDIESLLMNK